MALGGAFSSGIESLVEARDHHLHGWDLVGHVARGAAVGAFAGAAGGTFGHVAGKIALKTFGSVGKSEILDAGSPYLAEKGYNALANKIFNKYPALRSLESKSSARVDMDIVLSKIDDLLKISSTLDPSFYVFTVPWVLATAYLVFYATGEAFSSKKFSAGAFFIGPVTILISGILPAMVLVLYTKRYGFAAPYIPIFVFVTGIAWSAAFLLGWNWQVSGRRYKTISKDEKYSFEIRARRASTWPFASLWDWDAIEEEYQRNLKASESGKPENGPPGQ